MIHLQFLLIGLTIVGSVIGFFIGMFYLATIVGTWIFFTPLILLLSYIIGRQLCVSRAMSDIEKEKELDARSK